MGKIGTYGRYCNVINPQGKMRTKYIVFPELCEASNFPPQLYSLKPGLLAVKMNNNVHFEELFGK